VGKQVRRIILLGLIASVVAGACGGKGPPAATQATVPQSAPSTTAADPYAVPATIDAAYLNRVFAALEHVDGDATRLILESRTFPPDAAKRLQAIYAVDEFHNQTNLWLDLISGGLTGFRQPAGERLTSVHNIISLKADCIYAAVIRDYSQLSTTAAAPATEYIELRPAAPNSDPFSLNPTPWQIAAEGYNRDGSQPSDPCAEQSS
jgi:hypothetical protein